MNSPTLVRPLRLGRPWLQRLADDAGERLAAWAHGVQTRWSNWRQTRREQRELDAATELSDATLRDMGAPDWLQAQAHARREAQRFERELLRVEPRGGNFRCY